MDTTAQPQSREQDPARGHSRLARAGLAVVLSLVLIGGVVLFARTGDDASRASGQRIDAAQLEALGGEGAVQLASYRGRPLVLNFFASWCTFCIAEMPDFEKVHAGAGRRVGFLGVAMNDTPDGALRMVDATGVTYDLAADPQGEFFEFVGATGMPTTLFVDEEGRVVERFSGPLSADALRDRIDKHFPS